MNIPNALSTFRILLVPVFIVVFFSGVQNAYVYAALLFLLATFTDFVDGRIARKYNMVTMLGRILDPLADKLMVFSALVCMTLAKLIPWWVTAVYFVKELVQLIGGMLLYKRIKDVPSSNLVGKAAASFFYAVIVAILLFAIPEGIKLAIILVALVLILCAFISYFIRALRLARQNADT